MVERMDAADAAFLHRETRTAPRQVGGLAIFEPGGDGIDYAWLLRLLEERIAFAPRYRQRVRTVPAYLSEPVWVDDPTFDITYHVRRSALPRPGSDEQLLEFCARILSRLLDRSRPLWEMYLVEGLSGGRVAVVTKTHEAMVNGDTGIDLTQVLLDAGPSPRRSVDPIWLPGPEPSSLQLAGSALLGMARRPLGLVSSVQAVTGDLRSSAAAAASTVAGLAGAAGAVVRGVTRSPLQVTVGEHRRLAIARTRLADYRAVREVFGGSVNDVVLAVVTGALRGWLLSRGAALLPGASVRALVPVSVHELPGGRVGWRGTDSDGADPQVGRGAVGGTGVQAPAGTGADAVRGTVRPLLVDLPVGEPDAVLRLAQLRYAMAAHTRSDTAVRADRLASMQGFAAPTLHALGARAAHGLTRRMYSVVVANVPGPQVPLYAAGERMSEMFPVLPLDEGQAMSFGVTSYDGAVCFGVNADRDAVPEVALVGELIDESLGELVDAADTATPASAGGPRRSKR